MVLLVTMSLILSVMLGILMLLPAKLPPMKTLDHSRAIIVEIAWRGGCRPYFKGNPRRRSSTINCRDALKAAMANCSEQRSCRAEPQFLWPEVSSMENALWA